MKTKRVVAKFYNLDNYRAADQVKREIRALLDGGPDLLALCECIGNVVPGVDGYKLIRDTSRPGRENIALYVAKDLPVDDVAWYDCDETWTKTAEGATGQHWPRSWLDLRLCDVQLIVGHQPPKGTDNVKASQQEGIDLVRRRMAVWERDDWDDKTDEQQAKQMCRPRIALADWNRGPDEDGPGPKQLRNAIEGYQLGQQIDAAVCRGDECWTVDAKYVHAPNGVELESDHHDALIARFDVAERWWA